jgi:hypothetical protein
MHTFALVKSDWHNQFDASKWLLLPNTAVLEDVGDFVQSTIAVRKDSTGPRIQTIRSKVGYPSVCNRFWLKKHVTVAPDVQVIVHIRN